MPSTGNRCRALVHTVCIDPPFEDRATISDDRARAVGAAAVPSWFRSDDASGSVFRWEISMSTTTAAALQLAKDYIHFVETRDREALAGLLAPQARQVFVLNKDPAHPTAVFDGRDQVLAYTEGLFRKFERLVWINKDWTVSADATRVFLQAQSDGVARHSGKAYRNTYVLRIDIVEHRIAQILEYALDELFLAMETPVFDWDREAVALARTLPYATRCAKS